MDDMNYIPGLGITDDYNDMLNNTRGKQRTSPEEIRDVLDDSADDISPAVSENTWTDLLIYLVEVLEP